jgi:NAD(P)H-dependent FMN reductase
VDVIDRARVRLPAVRPAKPDETTTSFGGRLDQADAFVVVTPSNHGDPASLTSAIDDACRERQGKPVAFRTYPRPTPPRRTAQ